MRGLLVCLQFKYSNWLDNKKSILEKASEKKVMAKYETVVADKKLRESGFPLDPTMRKKSRGECKKKGKM